MKLFPKNVFFSGIVLFWVTNLFAQAPDTLWTKTYGGIGEDRGYSVEVTSDGGYIIVGYTRFGTDPNDIWLIKTDINGDTLWTKIYGGENNDQGHSVQQTPDEGYIIVGETYSFGAGSADIWLLKTDVNGDTLWTKTYGGSSVERGYSIQQTHDSGYIIVGSTLSLTSGSDCFIIKTDSIGDTLWTKTYGGSAAEHGYSIQQTNDFGYIITGDSWSFGSGLFDVWLLKTDSLGDTLWTKTYGGDDMDNGRSVQETIDGGYIIVGDTRSFGPDSRIWLLKTDANGDTNWTKIFNGSSGRSVQAISDDAYIIFGYIGSYPYYDVHLIKTDVLGNVLWTKTFDDYREDGCFGGQQTPDSGYIIVGYIGSNPYFDVYLIKTAPDVSIAEEKNTPIESNNLGATIFTGPLLLPEGKKCKVFDITGRVAMPDKIKPGIYFIEIDGVVTEKVVKVR